jgi:hypothetical protein
MFEMPYLGVIDPQNLSECYETHLRLDRKLLELDLNFKTLSASLSELNGYAPEDEGLYDDYPTR